MTGRGAVGGEAARVRLRVASVDDAAAIGLVHARSARVAYADIFPPEAEPPTAEALAARWRDLLDDPHPRAGGLVATVGGGPTGRPTETGPSAWPEETVVGAVVVGPDTGVPTGLLLHRLYVDPDHQGSGIGTALHDRAIERAAARGASAINLWVLEANRAARRLYEHRGWRLVPGPTLANEPPSIVDVLYQRRLP